MDDPSKPKPSVKRSSDSSWWAPRSAGSSPGGAEADVDDLDRLVFAETEHFGRCALLHQMSLRVSCGRPADAPTLLATRPGDKRATL